MLTLLIADDEPDICDLIENLIDWPGLEVQSLGKSNDGIDALEKIKQLDPDIVITDIRMPGLDGLEIIQKAHEAGKKARFIVVSGYREFEYAQNAIRFNVEDYLLKPIKREELNNILQKIIGKQKKAIQKTKSDQLLQEILNERTLQLRKEILTKLFNTPGYRYDCGQRIFNFQQGKFFVILLKIDYNDPSRADLQTYKGVLENICEKVVHKLSADCYDVDFIYGEAQALILSNYSESVHSSRQKKREYLQEILKANANKFDLFTITIAMGVDTEAVDSVSRSLQSAQTMIDARIVYGTGRVIDDETLAPLQAEDPIPEEVRGEIKEKILVFDTAHLVPYIQRVFEDFCRTHPDLRHHLYHLAGRMIQIVNDTLTGADLIREEALPKSRELLHLQVNSCRYSREICGYVCEYTKFILNYCLKLRSNLDNKPIRMAKQYVRENIDKQISLDEVAGMVFMSPGYFSTLFKEKTGVNFSNYVIQTRLDEAKKILKNSMCSVSEVAGKVGYADPKHFSRLFIKHIGVTPKEYRKFYSL